MKRLLHTSFAISALLVVSIVPAAKTFAASASDWKPGNIIDDGVFVDKNSMSVDQIQAFLNSHVGTGGPGHTPGVCDTNGTQVSEYGGGTRAQYGAARGHPAPFTCLKDYYEVPKTVPGAGIPANNYGGKPIPAGAISAAQIIWNAAQQYDISPKVMLTTIQKESAGPLITDDWPYESQYTYAMGAHCPDTAPCDSNYAGFSIQISESAALFRYYLDSMNQPWWPYKTLGNNAVLYNPNSACGSSTVNITSMATAALYTYTPYQPNTAALNNLYGLGDSCSSYGNRNFWRLYSDWFGSPTSPPATTCDSRVKNTVCVWGIRESDGSQFLTSSKAELDNAVYTYGWMNEGINFYASATESAGTVPVYRLRHNGKYVFTSDQSEYANLKATSGWVDEGIPFYTYPSTTSTNVSHTVYRLYNATLDQYYLTTNTNLETSLSTGGYSLEPNSFNSFSGLADLPVPAAGRQNIYRLKTSTNYFYTTSLSELEAVILSGYYSYGGVLTTAPALNAGSAVYRLRIGDKYFYTTNPTEKDNAINKYGYTNEGVEFYLDAASDQVYRLDNAQPGNYFYTTNVNEALSLANNSGWVYGGTLTSDTATQTPIFRFLNPLSNKHFYTIDIGEAMRITNKGWQYETVAFNASKDSGLPVYRLLLRDTHFYTTDVNEKNIAVSKYGFTYEGIAFYVSQTTTTAPVYRLQGSNGEYFYTASSQERDTAVSKYGYTYELKGFYLTP